MATSQGNPIVLNIVKTSLPPNASSLATLIGDLRKSILNLKAQFIADDGLTVDYEAMSKSPVFEAYKELASNLQFVDLEQLKKDENERKAFFINLYNVQMIHSLVAQSSLPGSPLQIEGMWSSFAYNVAGLLFTLDQIEHGILRCNQGHPKDKLAMFKDDDQRATLVLTSLDPRIHFALNCGARSCPPIRIYQGSKLDQQLDVAARSFINQDIEIQEDQKMVTLSKLLLWYKQDFGPNDAAVLAKLMHFVTDELIKAKLQVIIDNANDEKIKFRDYNWTLNSK